MKLFFIYSTKKQFQERLLTNDLLVYFYCEPEELAEEDKIFLKKSHANRKEELLNESAVKKPRVSLCIRLLVTSNNSSNTQQNLKDFVLKERKYSTDAPV